ncbi:MAG: hypothetical protein M1334_03930 [Patescibacteria group bacterium]|nr:hypothetical protein [Patescibacteria group bacterium]
MSGIVYDDRFDPFNSETKKLKTKNGGCRHCEHRKKIKIKNAFLISPVRNAAKDKPQMNRIAAYVKKLESEGYKVHWPIRDTKQDGDPIGFRICADNMMAMENADEIHVWYFKKGGFKKSTGSLFDLGEAFMLAIRKHKKIVLANPEDVIQTEGKSFENVLLSLSGNYRPSEKENRCLCECCDRENKNPKPNADKTCPICNEPVTSGDGISCRKCGEPIIYPKQD